MRVLILGGTSEALALGAELSSHSDIAATLSLAGRTRRPLPSGLPTRSGGFGGIAGLQDWLQQEGVQAVVDATHPFAVTMSAHAVAACAALGLPLARLDRPEWVPQAGDHWRRVPDLPAAADMLAREPALGSRVFLATGRSSLPHFEAVPDKFWLVRCVDAPEPPPAFARWTLLTDRGPFALAAERELLRAHAIEVVVAKNSGGTAAQAKLQAARELGLPVVMVDRPATPEVAQRFSEAPAVRNWLEALAAHSAAAPAG